MMSCVTDLIKANELGKKNMQVNNEPAFPSGLMSDDNKPHEVSALHNGITIRDYFATKAIQGMLADPKSGSPVMVASYAYKVANAMLEERKK